MYGDFGTKPCDDCGKSEDYCPECSTCHACLSKAEDELIAKFRKLEAQRDQLIDVAKAMRGWIDAVPKDTVLPAMPGFDRDWADSVINGDINKDDE